MRVSTTRWQPGPPSKGEVDGNFSHFRFLTARRRESEQARKYTTLDLYPQIQPRLA